MSESLIQDTSVKLRLKRGPISLVIDTSIFRKHLFSGWHLLTFLAARARQGKLDIHVPWIAHQEILTGIEEQVDDRMAKERLGKGLDEFDATSSTPDLTHTLRQQLQTFRETTLHDAQRRYQEWLRSAQAEVMPLTLIQSQNAWDSYFAGAVPFRTRKSRIDLPDGHILQALLALKKKSREEIHFITEDREFRDRCAQDCGDKIVCHPDIFNFCRNLQVPLDIADLKEKRRPRGVEPDSLHSAACRALQKELPRLAMRLPPDCVTPNRADRLQVQRVHEILSLHLDPNSLMHLEGSDYLSAFTASLRIQSSTPSVALASDSGSASPAHLKATNYDVDLSGHLLLRTGATDATPNTTAEIDAADVINLRLSADQNTRPVVAVPDFALSRYYGNRGFRAVTDPRTTGLVVVTGRNRLARRRLAEHLIGEKQQREPESLYLLGYRKEFRPELRMASPPTGRNEHTAETLIEDAWRLDAAGITLSAEEDWWLPEILDYVSHHKFAIVTMKGADSLSAAIRSIYLHPQGKDRVLYHLLAIAVVMECRGERISYRIAQGGDWGEGRWIDSIEHDRLVGLIPPRTDF